MKVPINVHQGMASGSTGVAKGVEYGVFIVTQDGVVVFHGNADTLTNIRAWPESHQLARALKDATGLDDLSKITLAPARPTITVDDGSRGARNVPVEALTEAADGAMRIKTKTDAKEKAVGRKMLCHKCPGGPRENIYKGHHGVFKTKAVAEMSSGAGDKCKECGCKGMEAVGPRWGPKRD